MIRGVLRGFLYIYVVLHCAGSKIAEVMKSLDDINADYAAFYTAVPVYSRPKVQCCSACTHVHHVYKKHCWIVKVLSKLQTVWFIQFEQNSWRARTHFAGLSVLTATTTCTYT